METIQALEKEQIKLAASGQGAWLQEEFTKIAETVKERDTCWPKNRLCF